MPYIGYDLDSVKIPNHEPDRKTGSAEQKPFFENGQIGESKAQGKKSGG